MVTGRFPVESARKVSDSHILVGASTHRSSEGGAVFEGLEFGPAAEDDDVGIARHRIRVQPAEARADPGCGCEGASWGLGILLPFCPAFEITAEGLEQRPVLRIEASVGGTTEARRARRSSA